MLTGEREIRCRFIYLQSFGLEKKIKNKKMYRLKFIIEKNKSVICINFLHPQYKVG